MNEDPTLTCRDEERREAVREGGRGGIDYLEVGDDHRTLNVYFLGEAPETVDGEEIKKENVRIEGGRRIRGIEVVGDPRVYRGGDSDDRMMVVVDRPGDFSTYTLRLVESEGGRPTDEPMRGLDPRYAQLEFSFKAGCSTDLDCEPRKLCPPPRYDEPEINYLAKDYASFRQLVLDRLALIMPGWRERHVPDLGVALVEVLAYVGDHLSYYQDAVATEAYLETARQRISVRRHARLVDYRLHEGCNARAWVCVETEGDETLDPDDAYFITGYEGSSKDNRVLSHADLRGVPSTRYEVFEPLVEEHVLLNPDEVAKSRAIHLYRAHNEMLFYTWGDVECCLPRGATAATLTDKWVPEPGDKTSEEEPEEQAARRYQQPEPPKGEPLKPRRSLRLREGDVLIFEEVKGPRTGEKADADRTRRHAVRLTRVEENEDPLFAQQVDGYVGEFATPVVEIEWAAEDALPFPLCLSTVGLDCKPVANVSVARGNVILADHGATREREELGTVPEGKKVIRCEDDCHPAESVVRPGRFPACLKEGPLTFSQGLPSGGPASGSLVQDPREATPRVEELTGIRAATEDAYEVWTPRRDLLGSCAQDRHFAVEVDNEGRAHLRFGDSELGRMPEAGTEFRATYRVGNGPVGNVGAETITHVVFRRRRVSGLKPRNPLPAQGGTAPEPLAEAKLFAPHAFRTRLRRAITADDYARLAEHYPTERHPKVQRAAATLRWTGSWYEALVAIDPRGGTGFQEEFAATVVAFIRAVRQTVERHQDLGDFRISPDEGPAREVIGILQELRSSVERDPPPERLPALVHAELPGLRRFRDSAGRDDRLKRWAGGLVAGLEYALSLLHARGSEATTDKRLLSDIEGYLHPYRRIGHDLVVAQARYVSLDIAMEVCVRFDFLRGHVKAALLDLFSNRGLSDGRRGFFHPDNLSFGDGIYLSQLVAEAQAVSGVESVRVTKLQRLFEGPNHEVENGVLSLGPWEIARLDNDPSFPENGVLRLEMGGGR